MLTLGGKTVTDVWYDGATNRTANPSSATGVANGKLDIRPNAHLMDSPDFITAAASYSHRFSDSGFALSGSVMYGQRKLTANSTLFTGTTGGTSSFLGYDLAGSYSITKALVFSAFYRVESWDALAPIVFNPVGSAYIANVAMVKMSLGGPGVGLAYSF